MVVARVVAGTSVPLFFIFYCVFIAIGYFQNPMEVEIIIWNISQLLSTHFVPGTVLSPPRTLLLFTGIHSVSTSAL